VSEEELKAQGAGMLEDSVAQLTPEELDQLLRGIPTPEATELVKALIGNKLDPRRVKKPGALLVGPLKKQGAARLVLIVERLSLGVLETFDKQLGDRFENPSRADLEEVLPAVLAEHPAAGVRCTLSWVVAEAMAAGEAARDVLLSDERLRLPHWPPGESAEAEPG
jgi:hypothetical protein